MSACTSDKKEKDQIEKLAELVDNKFDNTPKFMGLKPFLTKNWMNLFSAGFFLIILMLLILVLLSWRGIFLSVKFRGIRIS